MCMKKPPGPTMYPAPLQVESKQFFFSQCSMEIERHWFLFLNEIFLIDIPSENLDDDAPSAKLNYVLVGFLSKTIQGRTLAVQWD